MIHIDAHADTGGVFNGSKFHHGGPFRNACVQRGLPCDWRVHCRPRRHLLRHVVQRHALLVAGRLPVRQAHTGTFVNQRCSRAVAVDFDNVRIWIRGATANERGCSLSPWSLRQLGAAGDHRR